MNATTEVMAELKTALGKLDNALDRYEALSELVAGYRRERDEARAEVDRLRGEYQYSIGLSQALEERDAARASLQRMIARADEITDERDKMEQERNAAREDARAAWEAEGVMRGQRDACHVEWKREREEVERLRLDVATSNESFAAGYKDGARDAYRRGAEAMREACIGSACTFVMQYPSYCDDHGDELEAELRALPIPEDK